jgi:hypothetical protein
MLMKKRIEFESSINVYYTVGAMQFCWSKTGVGIGTSFTLIPNASKHDTRGGWLEIFSPVSNLTTNWKSVRTPPIAFFGFLS